MKEETNENSNRPSEAEMNDMHRRAWLDFHADAQEAKQQISRRYARLVEHFGSFKKMPQEMKDMFKEDYAQHEAKWGENGEEQQKRFGVKEPDPTKPQNEEAIPEYKSLADEKEAFLKKVHETRQQQRHGVEIEP